MRTMAQSTCVKNYLNFNRKITVQIHFRSPNHRCIYFNTTFNSYKITPSIKFKTNLHRYEEFTKRIFSATPFYLVAFLKRPERGLHAENHDMWPKTPDGELFNIGRCCHPQLLKNASTQESSEVHHRLRPPKVTDIFGHVISLINMDVKLTPLRSNLTGKKKRNKIGK